MYRSKITFLWFFGILFCIAACKNQPTNKPSENTPLSNLSSSPDEIYGELFDAVQTARIFPDSKTFADCSPKVSPDEIMKNYLTEKNKSGFDLTKFVSTNFDLPNKFSSGFVTDSSRTASEHIRDLWPVLTRQGDLTDSETGAWKGSTLIPLPYPYIVPGGRFGEVYYWDSYFTMLGLKADGKDQIIESMLDNFAYLIDTLGHIPNGNRTYYRSRSQPPFFCLMVQLAGKEDKYLAAMEKEYAFWMDGYNKVGNANISHRRVVWVGPEATLNRYWDDRPCPRPESYREDKISAEAGFAADRPKEDTYLNIKAGAESGWDFSSRWNVGATLEGVNTVSIIPIDLNCLMWQMEKTLSEVWQKKNNAEKMQFYGRRAYLRGRAIQQYCWNEQAGWFEDFDWTQNAQTGVLSAAGIFPLFVQLAQPDQAALCAKTLKAKFLKPGGMATTLTRTGQQWDAPNGWAPLQWVTIAGLRNYKQDALADDIKQRWVKLCTRVYQRTGKMLEKYNIEDLSLDAGGGEYPVQDGFGWTNGVLQKLLSER